MLAAKSLGFPFRQRPSATLHRRFDQLASLASPRSTTGSEHFRSVICRLYGSHSQSPFFFSVKRGGNFAFLMSFFHSPHIRHSMSFCKDCLKGVIHEGTPEGKIETIGGITCYVATPAVDYPKDKVVLMLTNVFGLPLLLADTYAQNGFKCIMPDIFNGDPVPLDDFDPDNFDLDKWVENGHDQIYTRPTVDKVVAALKAEGISTFLATGYCFGARYVFDLAFENIFAAAVVAHPSLLRIPADLQVSAVILDYVHLAPDKPQKYVAESKTPLLINSCSDDELFPHEAQTAADEIFAGFSPGYKREYFDGCSHGFAVRGDLSDPKVKAGKEGAFKATVEWFMKYV
ncbi:Dienelactone hydrolase endo--beta-d-glucanase [Mycena sanguinolenta]|uniref:Dienelactone hydrolase endo--beta-d-glucanase n=1 Tax=Mycena sanguinolenta TaxID=230812 RepID=A0A8H7D9X5_9AGAR|nr:Dienelactone hydrolase endo--beta-d-glucanase [Mycena sanguinolenta]